VLGFATLYPAYALCCKIFPNSKHQKNNQKPHARIKQMKFLSAAAFIGVVFTAPTSFANPTATKIVIDKSDHVMMVYDGDRLIAHYNIAIGRGGEDAKRCRGDKRTPEGNYRITEHKADSAYHYALRLSYPSAKDLENAKSLGCEPGSDIMIHGLKNGFGWVGRYHEWFDWTQGCIAITNDGMDALAKLAPVGTLVDIRP
jgi:murein L,D-transpeptidase YafK